MSTAHSELSEVRVLVVDDDRFWRREMIKTLRLSGYAAGSADNCVTALDKLSASEWDFVILDLRMPAFDGRISSVAGIDLLKYIKENHPGVEVAILTAQPRDETRQVCTSLGACAYLPKGSSSRQLLSEILLALPAKMHLPGEDSG